MGWILAGIAFILFGFVGIYYLVYKYDREKFEIPSTSGHSTDSILFSLLSIIALIVIAIFFEKLPIWLAKSILFLVCLFPIVIGVMLIVQESQ